MIFETYTERNVATGLFIQDIDESTVSITTSLDFIVDEQIEFTCLTSGGSNIDIVKPNARFKTHFDGVDKKWVIKEVTTNSDGTTNVVAKIDQEIFDSITANDIYCKNQTLESLLGYFVYRSDDTVKSIIAAPLSSNLDMTDCSTILTTKKRTIDMADGTTCREYLNKLGSLFRCEFEIDMAYSNNGRVGRLIVHDQVGSDKGAYLSTELNLKSFSVTSDSYELYTRIEPYGYEGLTIKNATIDGSTYTKAYIDSDTIDIYGIRNLRWEDTDYEYAQDLYDDAEAKLNDICRPKVTYDLDVADLASMSDDYSALEYSIGDIVHVIDLGIDQRIKEIVHNPANPENDTCTLSNVKLTFEELAERYGKTYTTVNNVTGNTGSVSSTSITTGKTSDSTTGYGTTTSLSSVVTSYFETKDLVVTHTAAIADLEATTADIENLTADTAFVNNLNANYAKVKNDLSAGRVLAEYVIADDIVAGTIDASVIDVTNLDADNITSGTIDASVIDVTNLDADNISSGTIDASIIGVTNLNASNISSGTIDASRIGVTNLNANNITSGTIDASVIGVTNLDADNITSGAIDASVIDVTNLNASNITSGAIDASVIDVTNLDADNITSGAIDASVIGVTNLNASNITSGTIDASIIGVTNLDADNISSGTIDASVIDVTNLDASNITTGTIDASVIGVTNLDADNITSGAIDASVIDVTNLDASNITTGTLNGSNINVTNLNADNITTGTLNGAFVEDKTIDFSALTDEAAEKILNSNSKVFYQAAAPTSTTSYTLKDNDVWFDTDDGYTPYYWIDSQSKWEKAQYGSGALSNGCIVSAKIATGAITANTIASGAITADKIAADAVTADKIAAGTITSTELASDAVTADKIAAGTITSTELASGAVTADKIAADAVTADKIAAGTITSTELASNAVTADKIAAAAVTAAKIASNSITSAKIAADAVTADKIAAGAITADKIAAGAITAAKIAAGTITSTELASDSVTADKLNVDSLSAITANLGDVTSGSIEGATIISESNNLLPYVFSEFYYDDTIPSVGRLVIDCNTGNAIVMYPFKGCLKNGSTEYDLFPDEYADNCGSTPGSMAIEMYGSDLNDEICCHFYFGTGTAYDLGRANISVENGKKYIVSFWVKSQGIPSSDVVDPATTLSLFYCLSNTKEEYGELQDYLNLYDSSGTSLGDEILFEGGGETPSSTIISDASRYYGIFEASADGFMSIGFKTSMTRSSSNESVGAYVILFGVCINETTTEELIPFEPYGTTEIEGGELATEAFSTTYFTTTDATCSRSILVDATGEKEKYTYVEPSGIQLFEATDSDTNDLDLYPEYLTLYSDSYSTFNTIRSNSIELTNVDNSYRVRLKPNKLEVYSDSNTYSNVLNGDIFVEGDKGWIAIDAQSTARISNCPNITLRDSDTNYKCTVTAQNIMITNSTGSTATSISGNSITLTDTTNDLTTQLTAQSAIIALTTQSYSGSLTSTKSQAHPNDSYITVTDSDLVHLLNYKAKFAVAFHSYNPDWVTINWLKFEYVSSTAYRIYFQYRNDYTSALSGTLYLRVFG